MAEKDEQKIKKWSGTDPVKAKEWAEALEAVPSQFVLEALQHQGGEARLPYVKMKWQQFEPSWKETVKAAFMAVATRFPGTIDESKLIG